MAIIHIYGSRSIFLIFNDNQDTKYESRDREDGVSGLISKHKNTKASTRELHPYSTIWEHNIVVILHIYRARDNSLLFCVLQDTESVSCEIELSISQPIFTHKKISKDLSGKNIYTLQYRSKIVW